MNETRPDDIIVRKADAAHVEAIAAFNVAMANETEERELDAARVRRGVAAVMANRQLGFYLVAEREGEVCGCLMITNEWSDWRNGQFWWIQSVYVTPRHRGFGVYRKLYQEVMRRALDDGSVCGVRLYVERNNTVAQQVYRKLGMNESGYLVYESPLPPP